jgi:hypothetical protein
VSPMIILLCGRRRVPPGTIRPTPKIRVTGCADRLSERGSLPERLHVGGW